eukprot:1137043-Pelagomonas_calceolata.AAC.4
MHACRRLLKLTSALAIRHVLKLTSACSHTASHACRCPADAHSVGLEDLADPPAEGGLAV